MSFNNDKSLKTVDFEKLAISSVAVVLTSTKYDSNTSHVLITVETDQIRYRSDGTAPDSTTGHLVEAGDIIILNSNEDIINFKAIRVTNSATVQISYMEG